MHCQQPIWTKKSCLLYNCLCTLHGCASQCTNSSKQGARFLHSLSQESTLLTQASYLRRTQNTPAHIHTCTTPNYTTFHHRTPSQTSPPHTSPCYPTLHHTSLYHTTPHHTTPPPHHIHAHHEVLNKAVLHVVELEAKVTEVSVPQSSELVHLVPLGAQLTPEQAVHVGTHNSERYRQHPAAHYHAY